MKKKRKTFESHSENQITLISSEYPNTFSLSILLKKEQTKEKKTVVSHLTLDYNKYN